MQPVLTSISVVVFTVVTSLLFAAMVSRLLGMSFGLVRRLAAGAIAIALLDPVLNGMRSTIADAGAAAQLFLSLLGLCVCVLGAMIFLVLAEVLVPTGSLPQPMELARGLRGRLARARRYSRITRIAVKHGLGPYLSGRRRADFELPSGRSRLAASLAEALDEAGVTFVKLGQILSTRRDLLPPEFVTELSRLRDRVAPAPWVEVEAVLVAELGRPVAEVFAEFTREPLAAASIAQVHAATLKSGERVVVKVQRPGIGSVVERDLDIVARLAATLHARTRWGRAIGVRELATGFADAMREELDFRVETANMLAVAAGSRTGVRYPVPQESLSGRRILVMERLDGVSLSEAGPDTPDREGLARTLLDTMLRQVMMDGVFHADPHPGNVLLLADGGLGMIDFGSVGRLDGALREALQRLLLAMDKADTLGVADALLEVVRRPDEIDQVALERAVGQFLARHLGPGSSAGVRMFTDLFKIVADFGLSVPPEVAAVFRALATLEGGLTQLAPGFDLVAEARGVATGYVRQSLDGDTLRRAAMDELVTLVPMLRRLPRRVERIAGALENGRLSLNIRLFADQRDREHVTGLLHQVLLTALGATAGVMAVMLLTAETVTPQITLLQLCGYSLLIISAVLVLRVLALIFRRER
ncbi:ABC1 kinase family protein [Kutzneria sp. NPDC052558]|uniref:ABC1 kinase family protein n=1 Tax=Kutzneria sp. NPDC052558 TaxID=3364121 RepID=UPI0037C554F5